MGWQRADVTVLAPGAVADWLVGCRSPLDRQWIFVGKWLTPGREEDRVILEDCRRLLDVSTAFGAVSSTSGGRRWTKHRDVGSALVPSTLPGPVRRRLVMPSRRTQTIAQNGFVGLVTPSGLIKPTAGNIEAALDHNSRTRRA